MEAVGEAIYARVGAEQLDSIVAAYLTLQEAHCASRQLTL